MDEERWTTAQIEAYLRQELPAQEKALFESELERSETLRSEVKAYQQVLDGLDSLHEQNFRMQLDQWNATAAQNDQAELIAWYIEGDLTPDGRGLVERQMAIDSKFKAEVDAYRLLIDGMEAVQDEQFLSQMKEWEKQATPAPALKVVSKRPMWQYAAAAVGAILIALSTLHLYLRVNYSGPALASTYYQSPLSERTMGEAATEVTPIQERLDFAHKQLIGKQYNAAFMAFDSLLKEIPRSNLDEFNKDLIQDQVRWNRLLAATAIDNPPIDLITEAERISQAPGNEYAPKALELLNDLKSSWYKWVN